MNTIGYFEIQATEPAALVRFYSAVFGWIFTKDDHLPIEYYRISTNSINGGLLQRPAAAPPQQYGTNAFVCSVEVDNFDRISELILANGGQVAMPKFEIPGRCWQGYFLDPDNNTIGVFEVMSYK